MKNKLMKVLITIATVLAFVIPSIATTTTAHADFNQTRNAVWLKSGNQYGNLNEVQQLHNGNQIYYSIITPSNNVYYTIWKIAVSKWNKLGVIKLVQVPAGDSRAQITLSGTYHYVTQKTINRLMKQEHHASWEYGNTDSSFVPTPVGPNQDHVYMTKTSAQLYPSLWAKSFNVNVIAATHELGHCLGFEHSTQKVNGRPVIMNAYNNGHNAPLGNYERNLLLQNYGEFLNQNNNNSDSSGDQSSVVTNDSNNG